MRYFTLLCFTLCYFELRYFALKVLSPSHLRKYQENPFKLKKKIHQIFDDEKKFFLSIWINLRKEFLSSRAKRLMLQYPVLVFIQFMNDCYNLSWLWWVFTKQHQQKKSVFLQIIEILMISWSFCSKHFLPSVFRQKNDRKKISLFCLTWNFH